ncbi:MAG: topoisomerase C-terminal repeat-containing protein [Fibrobacteres bacterium]|nr:topoisomerase C-terminal repeat-containing protein [Fibrobacterota bacterium]
MSKKLVIAEKPSVARDIARALGGFTARGKVFEREDLIICSAAGHLVELCMPEDLDKKKYGFWRLDALPIVPPTFPLKASKDDAKFRARRKKTKEEEEDEGGSELLDIIEKEAKRKDVTALINACDAGREGELIFTYIVKFLGVDKPYQRLWLQSMTQSAIKEGFTNLLPSTQKAGLADAAMCRSESDWLVGINATRAFTVRLFGRAGKETANLGRVQTPTLAILVGREREIGNFKPRPYWTAKGIFETGGETYEGMWIREDFRKADDPDDRADRIWEKALADQIRERCKGKPAKATDKTRESREAPPTLFDLTTLQREANKRFGFSARTTLQAAQALYERHKVLTYPRTDSKCLPEDYPPEVQRILGQLVSPYKALAAKITDPTRAVNAKKIFDNAKISDHFAIVPTGEAPSSALSAVESKIYDLVVRRFLAAFLDTAIWKIVERTTRVGEDAFRTTAKVLSTAGWREAFGKEEEEDVEIGMASRLPGLGGSLDRVQAETVLLEAFETKPPARYNDASLLGAMENAGKLLEDEELAEAMKERGLGTPATRAETIEKLVSARYVTRERKDLVPTAKAMQLVHLLDAIPVPELVSPTLTGDWEHKLLEMEKGRIRRDAFMKEIGTFTESIVQKAKAFDHETGFEESEPFGKCPTCGKPVKEKLKAYECTGCDFKLYKTLSQRLITRAEAEQLLETREIGPLDGFFSFKTRKSFSARVKLTDELKTEFVFEDRAAGPDAAPSQGGPTDLSIGSLHPEFPCPKCLGPTKLRKGRFGPFLSCPRYPECDGIVNFRIVEGAIVPRVPRKKKEE